MDRLLDVLRQFDALRDGDSGGDEVWEETLPNIPPIYADESVLDSFSSVIVEALSRRGLTRLYEHQADAISRSLAGANVVLEAPTASGKTLAFAIPMLEKVLRERDAHALMIYPTKALANDQRDQLTALFGALSDAGGRRFQS